MRPRPSTPRCAALAVALLALAPAGVLAQTRGQPAPAPAAKPAAAPAPATPAYSAAHLAAARDVASVSGLARAFEGIAPNLSVQILQRIGTARPELAGDVQAILVRLKPEFDTEKSELMNKAATVLAGLMSEPELVQTAAFFSTDAGKHYLASQPKVIDQMSEVMQAYTEKLADEMVKRVTQELAKQGKTL